MSTASHRLTLALVLAAAAGSVLIAWSMFDKSGASAHVPGGAPPALSPAAGDAARFEDLERRVAELAAELSRLAARLDGAPPSARAEAASEAAWERNEITVPPAVPTPEWYLEQYALSFRGGRSGSEYFRRNVEAFAPSLLPGIAAHVADAGASPLLRLRLVEMLGDARFAGNGAASDVLLRVVGGSADEELIQAACAALGAVGDARTGAALERLVLAIPLAGPQREAVRTMLALVGEGANSALARLLATAADPTLRAFLISLVRRDDLAAALDAFRSASTDEQPVRLQAAHAVGGFHGEDFFALVDQWAAVEPDERVRSVLRDAQKRMRAVPGWSARQAAGPPDVEDPSQDDARAWASKSPNMGEQWLELSYDPPRRASGVRIFEVCTAGAVARVVAIDTSGSAHELWSGVDPTLQPGVFELGFAPTSYRVARLRIVLDTNRRSGWNEIDAVELLGPEGRAFAKSATASSSYAD